MQVTVTRDFFFASQIVKEFLKNQVLEEFSETDAV